jgi:hypothetical protein
MMICLASDVVHHEGSIRDFEDKCDLCA